MAFSELLPSHKPTRNIFIPPHHTNCCPPPRQRIILQIMYDSQFLAFRANFTLATKKMSTIKLLSIVLTLSSSAMGYTRSTNRPFVRPFGLEEIQRVPTREVPGGGVDAPVDHKKSRVSRTRKSYDLGLGRNRPVYGISLVTTKEQSTEFWVEHEATQALPSPLDQSSSEPTTKTEAVTAKKAVPRVKHERRTKEELHIDHPMSFHDQATSEQVEAARGNSTVLPSIRATSDVQLDVNTIWVEMMLHSEQMKAAAAIQTEL